MMTSPIGRRSNAGGASAFTLIELILVMAILLIVIAVAAPSLKNFFRGRNLDSEARRFLSLTHYGQSRAISEGVPMLLWIDARSQTYGLEAQAGYLQQDTNAVSYTLGKDLEIQVDLPAPNQALLYSNLWTQSPRTLGNLPAIRFLPDGSIGETSPERVLLLENANQGVQIAQNPENQTYEVEALSSPRRR